MHELPGLSPIALEFGRRIAAERYRVLMPLLFGSLGQESSIKGFIQICIAREFTLLRTNRTSKVTGWLRELARERNDGSGVAAIGMCATGGLVLGLLLEDAVVAGVASQPSLPYVLPWSTATTRANLGLDPGHLEELEASPKPLLALRFKHDGRCPHDRLESMAARLGASVIEVPAEGDYGDASPPIEPKAHSVLTYDHVDVVEHPSHQAYLDVFEFLRTHLPSGEPRPPSTGDA